MGVCCTAALFVTIVVQMLRPPFRPSHSQKGTFSFQCFFWPDLIKKIEKEIKIKPFQALEESFFCQVAEGIVITLWNQYFIMIPCLLSVCYLLIITKQKAMIQFQTLTGSIQHVWNWRPLFPLNQSSISDGQWCVLMRPVSKLVFQVFPVFVEGAQVGAQLGALCSSIQLWSAKPKLSTDLVYTGWDGKQPFLRCWHVAEGTFLKHHHKILFFNDWAQTMTHFFWVSSVTESSMMGVIEFYLCEWTFTSLADVLGGRCAGKHTARWTHPIQYRGDIGTSPPWQSCDGVNMKGRKYGDVNDYSLIHHPPLWVRVRWVTAQQPGKKKGAAALDGGGSYPSVWW